MLYEVITDLVENKNLAQIGESKFWISDRYSRVIISADKQIPYRINQKDNFIFIDVQQSGIDPKFSKVQTFASGLLQQIRTNQTSNDSVRFELGLRRITSYNVCYTKLLRDSGIRTGRRMGVSTSI